MGKGREGMVGNGEGGGGREREYEGIATAIF